jgi:hypothetical protein
MAMDAAAVARGGLARCQSLRGSGDQRSTGLRFTTPGSAFASDAGPGLSDDLTGHFKKGIDRPGLHPNHPRQRQLELGRRGVQTAAHDLLLPKLLNRRHQREPGTSGDEIDHCVRLVCLEPLFHRNSRLLPILTDDLRVHRGHRA